MRFLEISGFIRLPVTNEHLRLITKIQKEDFSFNDREQLLLRRLISNNIVIKHVINNQNVFYVNLPNEDQS